MPALDPAHSHFISFEDQEEKISTFLLTVRPGSSEWFQA